MIIRKPITNPVMRSVLTSLSTAASEAASALAVPPSLRSLLFHDDGTATKYPAYYTEEEWAEHSHLLKDYSLGVGDLREKRLGYCYDFDGVDDYVSLGNLPLLNGATAFSISLWVNLDSYFVRQGFITKGRYYATNEFFFGMTHTAHSRLGYSISNSRYRFISNYNYAPGLNHAVLVYDSISSVDRIYLNGVDAGDGTSGGSYLPFPSNAIEFRLGSIFSNEFLDGILSDVQIYDYALTAQEVAALYAGTLPATKPIAHYPFQEESGATAYDISGNGNHGTILNAVTSGVGSIHQPDAGVVKSYANDEGYSRRMYFDGVDDAVAIPTVNLGDFTFSCKFSSPDFDTGETLDGCYLFSSSGGSTGRLVYNRSVGELALTTSTQTTLFEIPVDLVSPVVANSLTISRTGPVTTASINGTNLAVKQNTLNAVVLGGVDRLGAKWAGSTSIPNLKGSLWDVTLTAGGVTRTYSGYGNADADWLDQTGTNHGTVIGNPSTVIIPSSSEVTDALGGTLTYTGRCPNYGLAKGPAWQGDGSAVYVDLGSPVIPASSDFTITIPYEHVGVSTQAVFSQTETAVTTGRIVVYANQPAANRVRLAYIDLGNTITIDLPVCLTVNEFHLITASRTGNALRITCEGSLGTFTDTESPTTLSVAQFNTHLLSYAGSSRSAGSAGPFAITVGGLTTTYSPIEGTRNVAVTRSDGTYAVIANAVKNGALATLYSDGDGSWQLPEIANGAHFDGTGLYPAAPGASVAANGNALNIPANKHPIGLLVDRTGGVAAPFDYQSGADGYTNEAFSDIPTEITLNKRGLSIYAADRYGAALEDIQS